MQTFQVQVDFIRCRILLSNGLKSVFYNLAQAFSRGFFYQIETFQTVYRTVSIKRPGLKFFQKSLLHVRYDRKYEGLNILSTRPYNRMVRVTVLQSDLMKQNYGRFIFKIHYFFPIRPLIGLFNFLEIFDAQEFQWE